MFPRSGFSDNHCHRFSDNIFGNDDDDNVDYDDNDDDDDCLL